ncbi:unnamed protein product [Boreogadus saida]
MKQDLQYIHRQFPAMLIVYSNINERRRWRADLAWSYQTIVLHFICTEVPTRVHSPLDLLDQDSSGRGNSFHGSSFLREECLSSFVYVEEIAGAIVEKNGEPLKHCHNVIRDVCCPRGQIN